MKLRGMEWLLREVHIIRLITRYIQYDCHVINHGTRWTSLNYMIIQHGKLYLSQLLSSVQTVPLIFFFSHGGQTKILAPGTHSIHCPNLLRCQRKQTCVHSSFNFIFLIFQFYAAILGSLNGVYGGFDVGFASVGIPSLEKDKDAPFILTTEVRALFGQSCLLDSLLLILLQEGHSFL